MTDSLAALIVVEALVASYPTWTDEHGTNVEQLARVAVEALGDHGLLGRPVSPGMPEPQRPPATAR
ncbi:MAG: hypothetical protein FJW88_06245 [Actinobacteria bacterium]|nr:hypothetical protein [Actinomycetota bacterium]